MRDGARVDVLTAQDVAAILQVNKNTVYKLAKAGTLPSYKVGRKLRFGIDDVQTYIEAAKRARQRDADAAAAGGEAEPAAPPGISARAGRTGRAAGRGDDHVAPQAFVVGGRDILLDILANYLSVVGVRVLRSYESGYQELIALYFGTVQAAAVHLWDSSSDTYNLPHVKRLVPGTPVVVLHLAARTQGLLVRENNPLGLRKWSDLVHQPVVLANREKGSGSRILLDERLRMLEANPYLIDGYEREIASDLAQGTLIAKGSADVGVGTERVVHQIAGLQYRPLQTERLALVIAKTRATERIIRVIRGLLNSDMFRRELTVLPGYDFTHLGSKLYET